MSSKNTHFRFLHLLCLNTITVLVFRLFETLSIQFLYGHVSSLYDSEFVGLLWDMLYTNFILLLLYPIYLLFSSKIKYGMYRWIVFFIAFIAFIHFFILEYYLYQLRPLDIFLFQNSWRELLYTVNTSGKSYIASAVMITVLATIIIGIYRAMLKSSLTKRAILSLPLSTLIILPVFLLIPRLELNLNKDLIKNKSLHFYGRSIKYFFNQDDLIADYSTQDAEEYQLRFPSHTYSDKQWPLLHTFEKKNVLKPFFNTFDTTPNIVLIIVEGLNDDFIHKYKGVTLMPYLSALRKNSLYWNHCFTLGERSFAAVPSILGSLPYGDIGFTLMDPLPLHTSLVSILNNNDYYTSFFYGQESWFHKKDQFFRYNHIDLIFDKTNFTDKYEKVIVGDDDYFWGYNDRDLFAQYMEVLDTLPKNGRMDVFFTGTSHSPFVISNQAQYDERFDDIIRGMKEKDRAYFLVYEKYLKSLFFVDDAIAQFIDDFKSMPGYDNTMFIITGDHPMTEVPPANSLKRYHVPLFLFSPKLKTKRVFSGVTSHLDIYETLLSLLSDYGLSIPSFSTALGNTLNLVNNDIQSQLAFMNDNRQIVDYYSNGYYLASNKLFKVAPDLQLKSISNASLLKEMQKQLGIFVKTSRYTSLKDRILPDSLYYTHLGYQLVKEVQLSKDSLMNGQPYFNLLSMNEIPNEKYMDIQFEHLGNANPELILIAQIVNKKDSTLFWWNDIIAQEEGKYHVRFAIPEKQSMGNATLKVYLWNKNRDKRPFKFSHTVIKVFQKQEEHSLNK